MAPTPEEVVANMHTLVIKLQQDCDLSLIPQLASQDFINHTAEAGLPADFSSIEPTIKWLHATLEGMEAHIDHCVSDGKTVATNKTFTGIHRGEFMGQQPDGKKKMIRVMDFCVVDQESGKVTEHWACISPPALVKE